MAVGRRRVRAAFACLAALLLAGCADGMSDLRQFVKEVKQRPGDGIEPLPEFEPYEGFTYDAADLRNPFRPRSAFAAADEDESQGSDSGPKPDFDRPKEPLEQYPLDSLKMVGTISRDGQRRGLVREPNGIIHRVVPGNYLGQNYGRITAVKPGSIQIVELVRDGQKGWMEREASLALSEQQ